MVVSIVLGCLLVASVLYLRREIFLLQSELDAQVSYYDDVLHNVRTDIIKLEIKKMTSEITKTRRITKKLGRPVDPNSRRQKNLNKSK